MLVLAWAVYAALVAGLGLWFSLVSQTTLRATIWTLLATFAVSAAPSALCSCACSAVSLAGREREFRWLLDFDASALAPPFALAMLAFEGGDYGRRGMEVPWQNIQVALAGVAGHALAAGALWKLTVARFGPVTGRMP